MKLNFHELIRNTIQSVKKDKIIFAPFLIFNLCYNIFYSKFSRYVDFPQPGSGGNIKNHILITFLFLTFFLEKLRFWSNFVITQKFLIVGQIFDFSSQNRFLPFSHVFLRETAILAQFRDHSKIFDFWSNFRIFIPKLFFAFFSRFC